MEIEHRAHIRLRLQMNLRNIDFFALSVDVINFSISISKKCIFQKLPKLYPRVYSYEIEMI